MSKFKAGDKVRIVKCSGEDAWYKNNIGELYTIDTNTTTLHDRKYWYIVEKPNHTIHASDIELVTEGETMAKEITTTEAVLHLQSLVDLTGDDVEIIIRENEMFVKAFGKQFYCENTDVLEEAAKAAAFLSRQEIV
jgi:hypothetical protein